jgi:hypothetical protein
VEPSGALILFDATGRKLAGSYVTTDELRALEAGEGSATFQLKEGGAPAALIAFAAHRGSQIHELPGLGGAALPRNALVTIRRAVDGAMAAEVLRTDPPSIWR